MNLQLIPGNKSACYDLLSVGYLKEETDHISISLSGVTLKNSHFGILINYHGAKNHIALSDVLSKLDCVIVAVDHDEYALVNNMDIESANWITLEKPNQKILQLVC